MSSRQLVIFLFATMCLPTTTKGAILEPTGLADYSSATASLFNNMKTPASIIAGAMVPIGLLNPVAFDPDKTDGAFATFLRRSYPLVAVMALCSELISVMWATVAVNQLTETKIDMAASVWHLIQRDFEIPWVATNAHFVFGMMGFLWVIGCRVYFMAHKGPIGISAAGMVGSCFLLLTSIVNRGVAAGGGNAELRFGTNVLSLFHTYSCLLWKRACSPESFGPLELGAMGVALASLLYGARSCLRSSSSSKTSTSLLSTTPHHFAIFKNRNSVMRSNNKKNEPMM
jgi:hypothetical protein